MHNRLGALFPTSRLAEAYLPHPEADLRKTIQPTKPHLPLQGSVWYANQNRWLPKLSW